MITLGRYFGDTLNRRAQLYFYEQFYRVRIRNELGSHFVASFQNREDAEKYAQKYVSGQPQ
jgi:hypothetical protein